MGSDLLLSTHFPCKHYSANVERSCDLSSIPMNSFTYVLNRSNDAVNEQDPRPG